MYLTCPNGAVGVGIKAPSYTILQTFTYHGVLFTYGILALAFEDIVPNIKKIWIELIMIVCIDLMSLGANAAYSTSDSHYDWFFSTGSSFGMSPYVMPFIMLGIIFAMCLAIYGLYYLFKYKVFKQKEAIQG